MRTANVRPLFFLLICGVLLLFITNLGSMPEATYANNVTVEKEEPLLSSTHLHTNSNPHTLPSHLQDEHVHSELSDSSQTIELNGRNTHRAPCSGGPVIDGITLDECIVRNFTVDGTSKSITVWYTKDTTEAVRTVDGNPVTLQHWINSDAEATQVAQWFEEAWQRFFADSGHHLYDTGCGNNVNVQMEDGVGWGGIAYWASSGNCNIGIDSPMVRNGGGQRTVYHEAQHYLQYSYDSGCYSSWKPNYPSNSEFVEGYADLGSNSVDATIDAGYQVGSYNAMASMYEEGYSNLFLHYWTQQLGVLGSPGDANYHIDPMYDHYEECDNQNTLYVLDTVIPALSSNDLSKEDLFLNFFASLWARDWADPVTQPELVYSDTDDDSFSNQTFTQNVTMSGGSNNWSSSTPDDWAARYFQVTPQSGCPYLQVDVDGAGGATLGINIMAADTSGPSLLRSAWIGEDFTRTFAAFGTHNQIAAVVNSFSNNYDFDITFTCVNPALNILEPRQTNFALVGDPASPIAYLERFEVTSGGTAVRGLEASAFSFDAEGSPMTISGDFMEVGDEYWTVILPPTQPAGTTFVDHQVCLNGSICDTELNSLLYVDPGSSDTALVFDASGSMDIEDVVGEGKRYILAQRAGKVEADLLRDGDRILITDFSAQDNPAGCGLPGGSGNCPLDIRTLLPRANVVTPGTITAAKNAIDLVSPRAWTPIGEALVDAKNQLLAVPTNTNPKYIFLLSDGEENVNRLYADVQGELISSGVVINTIGFGPEAPGSLLAQIATDTGGIYRPVPTTPGSLLAIKSNQALRYQAALAAGIPEGKMAEALSTPYLPGQLGLADVYDDFDTQAQDAARVFHVNFLNTPDDTWEQLSAYVDGSAQIMRFVVAGKQSDSFCSGFQRFVEVRQPGLRQPWIPISPPGSNPPPPANWDIRNSAYDDVLIVTNPDPGDWDFRTRYNFCIPKNGEGNVPDTPSVFETDFMMNMSLQSTVHLEGRLLGLSNNQGSAGDEVAIVATLLTRNGTLPGALVIAAVEKPGGTDFFFLFDDGAHHDGAADDGIYGWDYSLTDIGGSYGVRILTGVDDPANPGNTLVREWNGGFWIDGPALNDQDNDKMPDDWETRCKLDTNSNDAQGDLDRDNLVNIDELYNGTLPCDPDTDNGGESDGSEVARQANPLWPGDDRVRPLGIINYRPINQGIVIGWSYPLSYTIMT
ncbi:MAG: VWA domain-containing protein, partial [Chloroflexi bacterium]|nr:VWA domain-containing protein [Chloroflexota bacterium]